jgi:Ger(x)C family germination protein
MKMHRKAIRLFSVLICLATLTGCWDAKELDDLSVPLVAAYDIVLESEKEYPDDKYLVTVGVPVFYEDVKEKFHAIDTPGQIIGEGRGRRNAQLGEQVIFGQLQLLLLGDELGKKENLLEITDVITRNPRIKGSIFMIIANGRAVDIIKSPTRNYPNVGIYLRALMRNTRDTNFYPYTTLFQFNRCLISYETAALLPHVIYSDGEIKLAGSCLVNKGKTAAEIGREETEIIVMLRGIECTGTLSFKAQKDGKVIDEATFEGANSRKVTVKKEGDKYVFNIQIKLAGVIVEHKKAKPMQDGTDLLKVFQDSLEQHIKKRAEALVKKTQEEFKFDALNLANYIKGHTREKLTKEDIDKIIQEAEINVDVKVQIRNVGGKM